MMLILVILIYLSAHSYLSIDNTDESFTMSLIKHSYFNVIKYDALDVHPPLYYLLLKTFIIITTFWTKNVAYKFISARLFSILCLFLSYIVSYNTLDLMNMRYNKTILFILIVMISSISYITFNIRMYSLACLFILSEIFELINYVYYKKNKSLIFLTFFSICATYTHDFAALIAGVLILLPFIYTIYKHNFKSSLKWAYTGIAMFLSYLPWIFISFKQIYNAPAVHWISKSNDIKDSLIFFIIIIILGYPIFFVKNVFSHKQSLIFDFLFFTSIITLLIEIIVSMIMSRPIFETRYVYPLIFVDIYMSVFIYLNLLYKFLRRSSLCSLRGNCLVLIICILFILLGLQTVRNVHQDVLLYNPQVNFINKYIKPNKDKKKIKDLNIKKLTHNSDKSSRLYTFNTFAQYNNKILTKKENEIITSSKISNKVNKGNRPILRYDVWHTNIQ